MNEWSFTTPTAISYHLDGNMSRKLFYGEVPSALHRGDGRAMGDMGSRGPLKGSGQPRKTGKALGRIKKRNPTIGCVHNSVEIGPVILIQLPIVDIYSGEGEMSSIQHRYVLDRAARMTGRPR